MNEQEKHNIAVQALERIDRDFAFLGSVEELAAALGVSKCHLIRQVTERAGESPGKRLKRRRLEAAAALLRGRDYPVELVARMVGFSCGNYFSKVFARAYGLAPKSYRARFRAPLAPQEERLVRELENLYQL